MNKTIIKNALILFAFTLVLGFVLALVYGITKPKIDAETVKAQNAAYSAVFSAADNFEVVDFDKNEANDAVAVAGFSDKIDAVLEAQNNSGEVLGYVITVTAKDGSQGSITLSVGICSDGTVNGYQITDTSETPGLGLKASEPEFSNQFVGKIVDAFTVVKQTPASDSEIEAITGSTITSKAVANACNAAILYFNTKLGGAQ